MVTATRRKRTRRRTFGGTLLGVLIGLLVGLAVAVAAALYMTQSSVPFLDRAKRPVPPAAEAPRNGNDALPDPNRLLQRNRPQPTDTPPESADAPSAPPGVAAPAPGALSPPVAALPPPVAAPSGPPPSADPRPERSAFLLQAGAFRGQEDAESMKARLALIGFEARIVSAEVNGVTFYRVRVGPYGQLDDMNKARSRLAENGIEASVVRQR
jgi:cell division protein FtsN